MIDGADAGNSAGLGAGEPAAYAPLGPEINVNTTYARTQAQSDAAQLANGHFIVTWIDADFNTTAGRFLRAQEYAPDGSRVGGEITLATLNGGIQPSVAGLANGGYVLSWLSLGSLTAQVFNASGTAVGAPFTVTPSSGVSGIGRPDVAALAGGGFAVVWDDARTAGGDISGQGVHLRVFSATGAPVGGDLLVNTATSRNQADASIAALSDGGWVVTWTDRGASAGWVIKAQIYTPAGTKSGGEFVVNSNLSSFASSVESSVTTLAGGNFAVAWYDASAHHVQVFTAAGQRVGTEVTMATSLGGTQVGPVIAALADGGYAIAWTRDGGSTADGSGRAVFVQAFSADGVPNGEPRLVNSQTNGDQFDPSIVGLANGSFAVSWTDLNAAGADDDQVKAQVFGHPLPLAITSGGGGDTASVSVAENGSLATSVAAQGGGGTIAYQIAGGADAALFSIDAASGVLSFASAPDFEASGDAGQDNVYQVTVSASDGASSDSQSISVTVTNVNEAPAFVSGGGGDVAQVSIQENQGNVLALAAVDPDGTAPQIGIAGGADAALFFINPATGALGFRDLPDFETPRDADGDNVYAVIVGATDGQYFDYQTVLVAVGNVYEGLRFAASSREFSVEENTTALGTVSASGEGGAIHYSLTGGADATLFAIDGSTGALSFVGAPDFENGGDNVYSFVVSATDGISTAQQSVRVTVGDVDEAVEIGSYGGAGAVSLTIAENGSGVGRVEAADPEGQPVAYAIAGGADAALFTIDAGTGDLSFVSGRDHENPADADGDNVYDVVVAASTATSSASQAFAIAVENVNEGISIASNGGGTSASILLDEGTSYVTTVLASDPDGTPATYSIIGGPDAGRFTIDSETGVLSFAQAPDYEAPADNWGSNFYTVTVAASDGELSSWQSIQIGIRNVNEGLGFVSYSSADIVHLNVTENQRSAAQAAAVDIDGDAVTYSITGGADAGLFAIDAATGALSFLSSPDFETPADADGDNVYDVVVTASDGSFGDWQAYAVAVGNADEAVSITSNGGGGSASLAVAENGRGVTTVLAADPDGGTLAYAITGGADAARFAIDSATGVLTFVSAPDFEGPADAGANNVYDVIVSASDGTTSDSQALAVSVGNVDEGVDILSYGGAATVSLSIQENKVAIGNVQAVDRDGDPVTYAIAGGADAALFQVDSATGTLSLLVSRDYESPADAGRDNIYDVVVAASRGGFSASQAFAVAIVNVNEAPVITSNGGGGGASVTIGENSRGVATIASADPDGTSATYSIVGGADASRFTINAQTGVLQFVTAPDYELPGDTDGNNVYNVTVQASDGQLTDTQALSVAVSNLRDGNNVTGTSGNDSISGTSTNAGLRTTNSEDNVSGGGGHDTILGLGGDDYLGGDAGNDTLTGGAGADRLTGGLGKDQFVYTGTADSTAAARDVITDFSRSQGDRIDLSAIDANANLTSNQAFSFIGASAFSNAAGQLRFEQVGGNTFVLGDVNGDGIADLQIELTGPILLAASDFVL